MRMKKIWMSIILMSTVVSLLNVSHFFTAISKQPPQTVFLATTHYYEDYFFYLNHFFQGAHGGWLTHNKYTTEPTLPSFIYWSNVLLGKTGGVLGLDQFASYNLSLIILAWIMLLLSAKVLHILLPHNSKLILLAFIISTCSTSIMNRIHTPDKGIVYWPFQIWRTPHFAFDRLGGAPHQLTQTIFAHIFLLSLIKSNQHKSYWLLAIIALALLTTLNPIQAGVYMGAMWVTGIIQIVILKRRPSFLSHTLMIGSTIGCIFAFALTSYFLSQQPHIQSKIWEASQQGYTDLPFLLLSIGPASYLTLIAFVFTLKKGQTWFETFGMVLIVCTYGAFLSPIPKTLGFSNLRLLFPATSIFLGYFSIQSYIWIKQFIINRFPSWHAWIYPTFAAIFIIFSAPTLIWEVQQKIQTTNYAQPLMYVDSNIYNAFLELSKDTNYNNAFIASPTSHMDLLGPALSGHTSFTGHFLATTDLYQKNPIAEQILAGSKDPTSTLELLQSQHIRYILQTKYESQIDLTRIYPFLKVYYQNPSAILYQVKL